MKKELMVVTPEELAKVRTLSSVLSEGYNSLHHARTLVHAVEISALNAIQRLLPEATYQDLMKNEEMKELRNCAHRALQGIEDGQKSLSTLLFHLTKTTDPTTAVSQLKYGGDEQ